MPETVAQAIQICRMLRFQPDSPGDLSPIDGPRLWSLSQNLGVPGLFARRISQLPGWPPESVREWEAFLSNERTRQALVLLEARRLCGILEQKDIRVVVLKGAGLATTVYEQPEERQYRDLDLLVAPADVPRALALLAETGYQLDCDPEIAEAYRQHHFHLPLAAPGKLPLELHWALTRPDDPYFLTAADLFESRLLPEVDAVPLPMPGMEAQLLHIAANGLRDGFTELKRLVDTDRILQSGRKIDWQRLAASAAERKLDLALRLSLELASRMLQTPLGPEVEALPALSPVARRLQQIGIGRFPLLLPPSGNPVARLLLRRWLTGGQGGESLWKRRASIDKARFKALHLPWRQRAALALKRLVMTIPLAFWQLSLGLRPHPVDPFNPGAGRPNSGPPAEGRADTP